MSLEQIKFTVGDSVKVIKVGNLKGNDVAPNLKEGKDYVVQDIVVDSKGNQHLDVGLESNYNYIRSFETKEELPRGNKIHWCHPSRFKKV